MINLNIFLHSTCFISAENNTDSLDYPNVLRKHSVLKRKFVWSLTPLISNITVFAFVEAGQFSDINLEYIDNVVTWSRTRSATHTRGHALVVQLTHVVTHS